ncbi:MAG: proline racemase family protein [Thermoanaerobaculia bacterium]
MAELPERLEVVDSHTEGEPTRVVVAGWPPLAGESMAARRDDLTARHDALRRAVVCEPRGHDAVVGALLTEPVHPGSAAGVIFFNNVGTLGMCGHGTIGVVRTLEHLGRLGPGTTRLDTPVGTVEADLAADGAVTFANVPAQCRRLDAEVAVPGLGRVRGDVAWGGNWFVLAHLTGEEIALANLPRLLAVTRDIRAALDAALLLGGEGAIDHVELLGPASRADADAKNFVLCPGGEYDRSPCGTGTSATMAARHARGELALGVEWRQEGICGGVFTGWLSAEEGRLVPHVRGRAWVTGTATLHFDSTDPLRAGFTTAA